MGMANSDTYLLVVTVLEGRFIQTDNGSSSSKNSSPSFLPASSSQVLLLEGRFNDQVLVSDPIPLKSPCPKMMNELAWEITRKELHDFRIERKPVKLQLFAADSFGNKQLVGYHVFDIRSAQEADNVSHQWKPLLNPKFRGVSTQRPEIYCTLKILKSEEDPTENHVSSDESSLRQGSYSENGDSRNGHSKDLDDDLQVKETKGMFKLWDSRSHEESDCNQQFMFSVIIAAAKDILHLIPESEFELAADQDFYFQYNFLGTTIKTASFLDLRSCQFPIEKVTFRLCVPSPDILKSYFALNPSLELILKRCSSVNSKHDEIIGTTTVYLENMVKSEDNTSIAGEFYLHPLDESLSLHDSDVQPRVGLLIELEKMTPSSSQENSFDSETDLSHFTMSVDIRSLSLSKTTGNFFVQYSYPIFGTAKTIRSDVVNCSVHLKEVTFNDGLTSFNFASSLGGLKDSFGKAPLLVELVEKSSPGKNVVRGVAKINLIDVIEMESDLERKRISVSKVRFLDPNDEEIGVLKVIFCLKEEDTPLKTPVINGGSKLMKNGKKTDLTDPQNQVFQQLLVEAAVEIELWKQQQKKKIKQKLNSQVTHKQDNRKIASDLKEMEKELKETLERVRRQESQLNKRERDLQQMDQEYKDRLDKLDQEVTTAIQDLKDTYEDRLEKERKATEQLEAENRQLTHEINSLKLAANSNSGSHPKSSLYANRTTTRTQSLVRTNSVPSSARSSSLRT